MGVLTNPRQTVIVTCRSKAHIMGKDVEKDNAITLDWHMPVSFKPQLYAIAVGKSRFSHKLIQGSKAFVVNFIPFAMKEQALYCGRHSGDHRDKIKEAGITAAESDKVDCPKIVGAVGYIECEVWKEVDAGDHTIFIGKVINAEMIKDEKRLFHVELDNFTTTS